MKRRIFRITSTSISGNEPASVFCKDTEIGLPIYFAIRVERVMEHTVKNRMNNDTVYISWQTTNEVNTSHFELQRSADGREFDTIETFMAAGNSTTPSRYATTDLKYSFFNEKLHYRLKVVFKNGKSIYTDPIALSLNKLSPVAAHSLAHAWSQQ